MSDPGPRVIACPPFPPLSWDGLLWACEVELRAWSAFLRKPVQVRLLVSTFADTPPVSEHIEAFRFLLDQDKPLTDLLLHEILTREPWLSCDDYEEEIASRADLIGKLTPTSIYVHQESRDGIAYLGFAFECPWDNGNGLGVILHRLRLVEMGESEVAYFAWIARADAESGE